MRKRNCILLLAALALTGCWQKSANPFYTAKDIVAEPKLAGAWRVVNDDDDPATWTFTRRGEKEYILVGQNKEERHEYVARVFKLGDDRFIDLRVNAPGTVATHHLFRIIAVEPELKVAGLNPSWMDNWLKDNPGSLAHKVVPDPDHRDDRSKDERVLTADTAALQKFVRAHLDDADFFTGEIVLKKQAAAGKAK
jgi:hypothetical protein